MLHHSSSASGSLTLDLRVIATTDMHGHLGLGNEARGWAQVSHTVASLKAEQANHLFFDNGDFLQGTVVCDLAAYGALGSPQDHPIIKVMNHLKYDAVGLGNHEFDYGLSFLRKALQPAEFPVLCSNLETDDDAWAHDLLISKSLTDTMGQTHHLKIGVFSLIPPQVLDWCRVHLDGKARAFDFRETAIERVTALRSRGADVVFALCHAGDVATLRADSKTPLASDIAAIPGLDLVVCGHTHHLSPKADERRLLFRTPSHSDDDTAMPMVQPGDKGRYVGCVDLKLQKGQKGWTWVRVDCRNIAVTEEPDADLEALAAPWELRAKQVISKDIGASDVDISTYFALVECDRATRVAAAAKLHAAQPLLNDLGYKDHPVVVAASPFKAGHDGPDYYTAVSAGPITLQELYDIYPFFNAIDAFEITVAQALDWLEASASAYFQLVPGRPDQPLWNRQFPTYELDSLLGLTYRIDLSQPARFTPNRRQVSNPEAGRIRDLCYQGNDLGLDDKIVLITNTYRGGGGGNFPNISRHNRIPLPFRDVRLSLQDLFAKGLTDADLPPRAWTFADMPDTSVTFETGPNASRFVPSHLRNRLSDLGPTAQGLRKFRLSLST